jgi:sulfur transfer complex TusBCD TusB component (DsrH family)
VLIDVHKIKYSVVDFKGYVSHTLMKTSTELYLINKNLQRRGIKESVDCLCVMQIYIQTFINMIMDD